MRMSLKYVVKRNDVFEDLIDDRGAVLEITLSKNDTIEEAENFLDMLTEESGINVCHGLWEENYYQVGYIEMDREDFEELKFYYKKCKAAYKNGECKVSAITEEVVAEEEVVIAEEVVNTLEIVDNGNDNFTSTYTVAKTGKQYVNELPTLRALLYFLRDSISRLEEDKTVLDDRVNIISSSSYVLAALETVKTCIKDDTCLFCGHKLKREVHENRIDGWGYGNYKTEYFLEVSCPNCKTK